MARKGSVEAQGAGAGLTRRGIMKWGVLGVGTVVLGGAALAFRRSVLREVPAVGLSTLTPREYAILAAVADRVCPAPRPGAPDASGLQVALVLDASFANADPEVKDALKLVLGVFESGLTGALFGERVTPFTQLSADGQDRALADWRDSGLPFRKQVFMSLKGLCAGAYYGHASSWSRVGYDGPPSREALRTAYAMNLIDYDALRPKGG